MSSIQGATHAAMTAFPQTRWTLILSAKGGDDEEALLQEAFEHLAQAYWRPIYAYLRGKGETHDQAQEATQGFFAYILGRDFLGNLQPEGGRFRNFLLVALRRWMKDERNRAIHVRARAEIALEDWHEGELADTFTGFEEGSPERAFDRSWAAALVAKAMRAVEQRWAHRAGLFAALRLTVENAADVEKYADIAKRLGMTEGAVGKAAHDLRQHFAEQIRQEVRDTVARDQDVEGELRYLIRLLRD